MVESNGTKREQGVVRIDVRVVVNRNIGHVVSGTGRWRRGARRGGWSWLRSGSSFQSVNVKSCRGIL